MQEVYDKGFMNVDYATNTYDYALEMLVNGDGAHYPMLTGTIPTIYATYGDELGDNIGVFAQPGDNADDVGLTVWMPDSLYLFKNGDNVDLAYEWLTYYLSEEAISIFAAAEAPSGPFMVKGVELKELCPAIEDMMTYVASGKTCAALEFSSSVKGPNSPQICIECLSGLATAEEAAAEYDADAEKQAKQLGLEGW